MLLFALKNVVILVSPFNRLLGQTHSFSRPHYSPTLVQVKTNKKFGIIKHCYILILLMHTSYNTDFIGHY